MSSGKQVAAVGLPAASFTVFRHPLGSAVVRHASVAHLPPVKVREWLGLAALDYPVKLI